ncbi:MAG: TorF family putative porin [Thalassolituus sp.]
MLRHLTSTLLPVLFCSLTASVAVADISADVGATTEFVRDGISQSGGKAAWQAGMTATHNSGLYAGIWGSNLDHGGDDHLHSEWDAYAGANFPLWRAWSFDTSITRFTFHGDADLKGDAYNESSIRLLWDNHFTAGYRVGDGYYGSDYNLHTLETAYTFQSGTFSIELYLANHRLDGTDDTTNFGSTNADDYWHFRVGAARTWNHWDYRLTLDRTNLGREFDAGTTFQFSAHRYFRLW